MLDRTHNYTCPYCGNTEALKMFLIKKGDGYSDKWVRCTICSNRMKKETLIANMTPFEWGLWLYCNMRKYNNPHNKFSEKIDFKHLWINLRFLGEDVYTDFLNGFRSLKGKNDFTYDTTLTELNLKYGIWKRRESRITLLNFTH